MLYYILYSILTEHYDERHFHGLNFRFRYDAPGTGPSDVVLFGLYNKRWALSILISITVVIRHYIVIVFYRHAGVIIIEDTAVVAFIKPISATIFNSSGFQTVSKPNDTPRHNILPPTILRPFRFLSWSRSLIKFRYMFFKKDRGCGQFENHCCTIPGAQSTYILYMYYKHYVNARDVVIILLYYFWRRAVLRCFWTATRVCSSTKWCRRLSHNIRWWRLPAPRTPSSPLC